MQRLLGPTLGRFQSEFLNPLIERVFGLMVRANALQELPEILDGQTIDIEFVGPLARSQRMEEAVAVERLYQLAMQVTQLDPNIMDVIDHDKAIRMRAELLGVPKSILRGIEEVNQMREAKAQMAAMQQQVMMEKEQAAIAAQQSSTAKNMAQPETRDLLNEAATIAEEEDIQ